MMTLKKWKKDTAKFGKDRKNPLITDIDLLLSAFHQHAAVATSKVKYAILIRHYCNEWIFTKQQKKGSFRRSTVQDLLADTGNYLLSSEGVRGTVDRYQGIRQSGVRQGKKMEEDPIEVLQPRAPRAGKLALAAGLQFPRRSAGDALNDLTRAGKDQTNLLEQLDKLQELGQNNKNKVRRTLIYLNKADRQNYIITFAGGSGTFAGSPGPYTSNDCQKWLNTPTAGFIRKDIYAMNDLNELYVQRGDKAGAGTFHHSSFLSGKPVTCAGEVLFLNGAVRYVSNESGHYRPSTQQLIDIVEVLRDVYHVNLAQLAVADLSTQIDWATATNFLAARGRRLKPLPTPPRKPLPPLPKIPGGK